MCGTGYIDQTCLKTSIVFGNLHMQVHVGEASAYAGASLSSCRSASFPGRKSLAYGRPITVRRLSSPSLDSSNIPFPATRAVRRSDLLVSMQRPCHSLKLPLQVLQVQSTLRAACLLSTRSRAISAGKFVYHSVSVLGSICRLCGLLDPIGLRCCFSTKQKADEEVK